MNISSLCHRDAVTVSPSDEVLTAARVMREQHVGYLVVVAQGGDPHRKRPVGVLTDRDIVVTVVARQVDPASLRVGDVMTQTPVQLSTADSLEIAVRKMRRIGVRRMPLVDADGELVGVISLDEVLDWLAAQLLNLAGTIQHEQAVERQVRPAAPMHKTHAERHRAADTALHR